VDTTLEEEDDGTEEDDRPSTRAAPVSDHEAPDDQHIKALRDDPDALANILRELRQCQQDLAALRAKDRSARRRRAEKPLPTTEDLSLRESSGLESSPLDSSDDAGTRPRHSKHSGRSNKPRQILEPLADPEHLSDGLDPDFDSWEILMRRKLHRDDVQFPTEREKLEYILSRTKKRARQILAPRLKRHSLYKIKTVKEAFSVLRTALADVHPSPRRSRRLTSCTLRRRVITTPSLRNSHAY